MLIQNCVIERCNLPGIGVGIDSFWYMPSKSVTCLLPAVLDAALIWPYQSWLSGRSDATPAFSAFLDEAKHGSMLARCPTTGEYNVERWHCSCAATLLWDAQESCLFTAGGREIRVKTSGS